jgi:FixJ family two-component response regulator
LALSICAVALIRQAIQCDGANRKRLEQIAELRAQYQLLTQREREVLAFVVSGLLNEQISAELGTSGFTIKIQRGRVMQKMRAGSLAELVPMAKKVEHSSSKGLLLLEVGLLPWCNAEFFAGN